MPEPQSQAPIDLREILQVLLRRKWLVLLPWMAAVAAGIAAALLLRPIYFSNVTLLLERPQQLSGALGGMVGGGASPDQQAEIMREQVQSSLFLRSVVTATGVKSDAVTRAWALKSAHRYPGLSADEAVEMFLVNYLRDAITIKRTRGNIFQITVGDYTAERARKFAEGVANQFVVSSKAAQLEAVRATQEFSVEQQQIYKKKLEEAESRLEAVRRSAIASRVTGSKVNDANIGQVRALVEQAGVEELDQHQRLADLRAQFAGRVRENDPELLSSPAVSTLTAQLVGLERQLAGAMISDPSGQSATGLRISLARKSSDLERELSANVARALPGASPDARELLVRYRLADADLQARSARSSFLAGQVSAYEQQAEMTPDREMDVTRLQQEVDNARALYNSFLQQSAAAQIAEAFENAKVSGRFSIMEPATSPLAPGKPNRPMLLLLSLIAGGMIGVGTVLVVEHQDQSVKNAEEVESLLGLPVLGAIPRVEELERGRRRGRARSAPAATTALPAARDQGMLRRLQVETPLGLEFRRIYLKLARTRGRQLPRTLLITSSTRGEGKTTTAACLAITLAREHRQRVLLVDSDLRSPTLHRALGLPGSTWGLAQMLQQRQFDERFVRATALQNLDFLAAGKSERPASELIDAEAVEWFLKEATARYPLVLLDAAPNLAVPDPLILGRAVDGVLYVVKAGSTVRKAAEYGVRVQREARDNLLGVLMNDVGEFLPQYYGYRYNAYGYAPDAAGGET